MPKKEASPPHAKSKNNQRDDSKTVLMALFGMTVAFVFITIIFIGSMLFLNNPLEKVPDTVVPDIVGLKYDDIKNAPEYKKFEIVVEERRNNAVYPIGAIIEQSPKEGKTVKENSMIKVIVSTGQQIVAVPNIIGIEETLAYQELDRHGLKYKKVAQFSVQAAGTVVYTDPAVGTEVPSGTEVGVIISMGPENKILKTPNLKGMTLDQAKAELEKLGLKPGGISYVASEDPPDTVISQDPSPEIEITFGGYVNLNVSGQPSKEGQITLSIPLPSDVTDTVKMTAMHEGAVVQTVNMVPSIARIWKPTFSGTGAVVMHILYNDFLYMTVSIDFTTGAWAITEDNSQAHN